jgi:hypothetical protein
MLCWVNPIHSAGLGPTIVREAGSSPLLRLTRAWLGRAWTLSPRRLGLLNAPGDLGWELPTLLPGRDTGEHTCLIAMGTSIDKQQSKELPGSGGSC